MVLLFFFFRLIVGQSPYPTILDHRFPHHLHLLFPRPSSHLNIFKEGKGFFCQRSLPGAAALFYDSETVPPLVTQCTAVTWVVNNFQDNFNLKRRSWKLYCCTRKSSASSPLASLLELLPDFLPRLGLFSPRLRTPHPAAADQPSARFYQQPLSPSQAWPPSP